MKGVLVLLVFFGGALQSLRAQKDFNIELLSQVSHPIESNDIWGYVDQEGTEYAVIGTDLDCRIYELTDPTNPKIIATIPGAQSIWRDFKSYRNYVYQITQRGDDGLTIIDMTHAPDSVSFKLFKGVVPLNGGTTELSTCHNLYIDTIRGLAFLAGCNIGVGGVLIYDIATDPLSPVFLGAQNERYSHDVVTKGDTLFSSEINEGNLGIYDISDPSDPVLISRTRTSSIFTHNAWYSDDGNYVFTTDERPNASVDAYDIRDLESPMRIDRWRPAEDEGIIPHNTHYMNGYLITSWYTEGVIILDAHRPDNLVKVGQYDTYTGNRVGFEGNWGAFPYLPSGLLLASDLASGLFVLQPSYERAAYLEGTIVDAVSSSPINAAVVVLNDCDNTTELSRADGIYKTGTADDGIYEVIISHPDFITDTISVVLTAGEVTDLSVRLERKNSVFTALGKVVDPNGNPIEGAQIIVESTNRSSLASSDRDGFYKALVDSDEYKIYAAAWGYKGKLVTALIEDPIIPTIELEEGYEDDFFVDLGWTVKGDARTGNWERVIPKPTFFRGDVANPGIDVENDLNEYCYVTGNNDASVGADDVDDGTTTLISPPINVDGLQNAIIELSPWFFNSGGESTPNDTLKIYLVNDEHQRQLTHFIRRDLPINSRWIDPLTIYVDSIFKRSKVVHLEIEVSDQPGTGHLVEAGIDRFRMYEGPLPEYPDNQEEIEITVAPNPNQGMFYIDVFTNQEVTAVTIYNINGARVYHRPEPISEINILDFPKGTYVVEVQFESGITSQQHFIKL